MSLTFVPLGIGDAFSSRYYSSCLAVMADGGALLVDCPHPIRKMLFEASGPRAAMDIGDFNGVVLTHLHADHASGVEGYLFYSRYFLGRLGTVIAHEKVLERLWPNHLAAGMEEVGADDEPLGMSIESFAATVSLNEETPSTVGPFAIECRRTKHNIPTFALKIHADGACLGYSADTGFDPELIDWLKSADLVIHETNRGIHTPYVKLAALPAALRERMRLIHFNDDFDTSASIIAPLAQGREYTVG